MPLTGEGADSRYVHLLDQQGVHLTIQCPDCKRDLCLMAQISSLQCAQDKDGAKSLSPSQESIVLQHQQRSLDSFDLQSTATDDDFTLSLKREKRARRQDKKQAKFEEELDNAFAKRKRQRELLCDDGMKKHGRREATSLTETPEAVERDHAGVHLAASNKSILATSDDSSVTIDPTNSKAQPKSLFSLKPPPSRFTNKKITRFSLESIDTAKDSPADTPSPLSK